MSLPKTKQPHDIFLSYAMEDAALADGIARHLRAVGATVWHDASAVSAGDSIRTRIEDGIEASKWVGLLFTAASTSKLRERKGYLRFEEYLASVEQDLSDVTRVLPLVLDPSLQRDDLPLKYRDRRSVDLTPTAYASGFKELFGVLGHSSHPRKLRHPKDGTTLQLVSGGTYAHGSGGGTTLHAVSDFYIAARPTTNEQYANFMQSTRRRRVPSTWRTSPVVPPLSGVPWWNKPEEMVRGINVKEADSYAKWAGLRLQTAYEFEYLFLEAIPNDAAQIDDRPDDWFEWTSTSAAEFKGGAEDSRIAVTSGMMLSRNFQVPFSSDSRSADLGFRCAADVSTVYQPLFMPSAWRRHSRPGCG